MNFETGKIGLKREFKEEIWDLYLAFRSENKYNSSNGKT